MLLIDGVRYELWTPSTEDEFERMVKEHTQDIFGEQSIYLDRKQKIKSLSGIGSIPDGYVIILGDSPHWHIVEVELSSHPPHEHIVPQLNKFALGIKNPSTQNNLVNAIYEYISGDGFATLKLKKETNCADIHRFLADLISKPPVLTVIIEKKTKELEEALGIFRREYQTEIVEFQTFTREGIIGLAVHAHIFKPLYKRVISTVPRPHPLEVPFGTMKIKVWSSYRQYEYIGIWKNHREFFPQYGTGVELMTDDGDIFKAKVGKSPTGSTELWGLRDWYSKNPDLKEGDLILITPVEAMKKYRIQTRRRQQ